MLLLFVRLKTKTKTKQKNIIMAKKSFKLEDVEFVCDKNQLESEKRQAVINDLKAMLEEEEEQEEVEKVEYKIAGLFPDGEGYDKIPLEDRVIIPIKLPVEFDTSTLQDCMVAAATKHNESRRAKKQGKIFTLNDLLTKATKKNLTEEGIKVQCDARFEIVPCNPQLIEEK